MRDDEIQLYIYPTSKLKNIDMEKEGDICSLCKQYGG